MGRPERKACVQVNQKLHTDIGNIRERTNAATLEEVVQRAVNVFTYFCDMQRDGYILVVRNPATGKEKEVLV